MEPQLPPPSPPSMEPDIVVSLTPAGTPQSEEEKAKQAAGQKRRVIGRLKSERESMERWLLTYCDLITLLMALFVIMYATSRVKEGQKGISVEIEHMRQAQARERLFLPVIPDAEVRKMDRLLIQIDALRKLKKVGPFIHLTRSSKGLVIHMPGGMLFDIGQAELKDSARRALDVLVPSLQSIPNQIRVEGHTDNVPIHTEAYPSNWHLSTARAISVVDYLVTKHKFPQDRFSALGYADLKPLRPNTTPANRARNRRVDIVLVYDHAPPAPPR